MSRYHNKTSKKTGKKVTPLEAHHAFQRKLTDARKLVSATIFAETTGGPLIRTIVVPVPNQGWAPAMWCGEFAVVDITDQEPRPGTFVLRRSDTTGDLAIVRLELWDETTFKIIRQPGEAIEVHWNIMYPAQSAIRLDGTPIGPDDPLAHFHMCDGPLPDSLMRKEIVGRITGIVGHEDRAMDWRRWTA